VVHLGVMKIGVFDSGIGGQAVANRLSDLLPEADIISINDHQHVPYGTRTAKDIISLTTAAIQPLIRADCDAIVIACNTATTVAITHLRSTYPDTNFVGIEPMVKPAAELTRTKTIAILATPATLASEQYALLKNTWAQNIAVIEPDCASWAALIEAGTSDLVPIEETISDVIANGADVIVLACTHYHWLKDRAEEATRSRATVLEPSDAISNRILTLLSNDRNVTT